jgi:multicomponent Na+:H+ antiporter subunit C
MELLLAIAIGVLYGTGVYMMLRRSLVKVVIGFALISNGANLLIFTASGVVRTAAPIIGDDATVLMAPYADPLPQALVLTAIVITFGVSAFALALVLRVQRTTGAEDPDEMRSTDADAFEKPVEAESQ